jgi:glycosyltransferase involved in cell wall biosynthesis
VLPTLSENFGLVVAEALERGKRVITTDGAPVWGEESGGVGEWRSDGVESRYGGRLLYLKGFRDGSDEERVRLLKEAVSMLRGDEMI